jgi:hypothetical protein
MMTAAVKNDHRRRSICVDDGRINRAAVPAGFKTDSRGCDGQHFAQATEEMVNSRFFTLQQGWVIDRCSSTYPEFDYHLPGAFTVGSAGR